MEFGRTADCFDDAEGPAGVVHALRPGAAPPPHAAAFMAGFRASAGEVVLIPGEAAPLDALLGLGDDGGADAFGALPGKLPATQGWRLAADADPRAAALAFARGAYRHTVHKTGEDKPVARLRVAPDVVAAIRPVADAIWLARDLINAPPNVLGPAELADAAAAVGARHGAAVRRVAGAAVAEGYPALAAVGAGSDRAAEVVRLDWRGSGAGDDAPHIFLCGKGVCFDTGGYDLKPSSAMLKMKKDMGGAAVVLGVAHALMAEDAPVRLSVLVGCVENSVSGHAMRPSDVLATRRGLRVEVGNTDAEGRLVLADLLDEACADKPALLLDCATLTGAARVALGPEIVAMFSNDDGWAGCLAEAGVATGDFVWRLPLHHTYRGWLDSPVADLNTVSSKPFAGAVVAALFLERFVSPGQPWVHLDLYAANDVARPGFPEGGEATGLRAVHAAIRKFILIPDRKL